MKPTLPTIVSSRHRELFEDSKRRSRRSPLTDYNYHSLAFDGSAARCTRTGTRSFWNIAGDYYKTEARQDFWGESSLWAVLVLTAFLPLISSVHAVMEFVSAISGY